MGRERTVSLVRVFDAPRSRVFDAWTRAEHLARWFSPKGFTVPACEADARPGGVFRLCMRSPDGREYWMRGAFSEVVVPERLVIAAAADDERGIERIQTVSTVTFAAQGGKTKLTLRATAGGDGAEAGAMLDGMEQGWTETIGRLAAHLAN